MNAGLADLPAAETIHAGGAALLVRRLGAGPRLVLLHGGPGLDHHLLLPLALPLARRHEVWLVDLPGHGRAGGAPVGFEETLRRLGPFVDALGPAAVGGHSLGALLLRELLRRGAIEPRAAFLLCPPGPGGSSRAADPGALPGLREALLAEIEARHPADRLAREAVEAACLRDPRHYARLGDEVHSLLQRRPPVFEPRGPVLVVGGRADSVAPPAAVRSVCAAIRGARLELLPGAGHYPWVDAPGRLLAVLDAFLCVHQPLRASVK